MDDIDRYLALLMHRQQVEGIGAALERFVMTRPGPVDQLELARLQYAMLQDHLSLLLLGEQQIQRLKELLSALERPEPESESQ